jgi:RNA polymerase sigma factor (sigma-70 family)
MDTRTDEQLMGLYQQGNMAAFDEIYARYNGPLLGFIKRSLHGMAPKLLDDSADILQNVFGFIHKYRGRFIRGTMLKPWLFTTADRLLRNHIEYATRKRRNVHHTRPLPLPAFNDPKSDDPADDGPVRPKQGDNRFAPNILAVDSTEPAYIAAARTRAQRFLAILPDNYQQVLRSLFFEGLTSQETAKRMRVPKSTIDWWKRDAIDKMRATNTGADNE